LNSSRSYFCDLNLKNAFGVCTPYAKEKSERCRAP
jgi:hypothetical protein